MRTHMRCRVVTTDGRLSPAVTVTTDSSKDLPSSIQFAGDANPYYHTTPIGRGIAFPVQAQPLRSTAVANVVDAISFSRIYALVFDQYEFKESDCQTFSSRAVSYFAHMLVDRAQTSGTIARNLSTLITVQRLFRNGQSSTDYAIAGNRFRPDTTPLISMSDYFDSLQREHVGEEEKDEVRDGLARLEEDVKRL